MLCSYIFSDVTLILSQLGVLFSLSVCTEKKVVCLLQFPRNLLNYHLSYMNIFTYSIAQNASIFLQLI